MTATEWAHSFESAKRRHPRLVSRISWLTSHLPLVVTVAAALIILIAYLDLFLHPVTMAGFYLLPLTLLALAGRERLVLAAGVVCGALTIAVMALQGNLTTGNWFNLLYGCLSGMALVALAYLIRRLTMVSEYAMLRAQLAEAGAAVLMSGGEWAEIGELLEYTVMRLAELLGATVGVMIVLRDQRWVGRCVFGSTCNLQEITVDAERVPIACEALRADNVLFRDAWGRQAELFGPLAEQVPFERTVVFPMRSMEHEIGVLIYSRPQFTGEYDEERVAVAAGLAQYLGIATENVRLMLELSAKRRALETVRDASLDFAQSLEIEDLLRVIASRLLEALAMPACTVFEVDEGAGLLRRVYRCGKGAEAPLAEAEGVVPLAAMGVTKLAVQSRRSVFVDSIDDPQLSRAEREALYRAHRCVQFSIPIYIREHVLLVVELYDRVPRELSAEKIDLARTICRFAALAVDTARLFKKERALTERRDRLARRLQRLQSFAVELNRRLDRADEQEILDEVVAAAADLLHVRAAAVLSGVGEYTVVRASTGVAEEELLERYRSRALGVPADLVPADDEVLPAGVSQDDDLLMVPVDPESMGKTSMLVVSGSSDGEFDDEDELLITTLAAQLGASLHNAMAYQREHAIAETFQEALLQEPPFVAGVEMGVRYRAATDAARIGGDFYDLVMLAPGKLMVTVGDVCGKGLGAAAHSATVRYMLRAYVAEGSPGEALSRLNAAMDAQAPSQPYVTLFVAFIDVVRRVFEYAIAGHPRPIVVAGGKEFLIPQEGDTAVGLFRGRRYSTHRVVLPAETRIVLYTDGIIEARRGKAFFGEEGVRRTVMEHLDLSPQGLADTLLETVREYAGGVLTDDCAVVVLDLP